MTEEPVPPSKGFGISLPDIFMFLLEIGMWVSFGWIGWSAGNGARRWLFALVFDRSSYPLMGPIFEHLVCRRPGAGGIPTPGPVRLVLEVGLFLLAGYGLWVTGYRWIAETLWTFAALIYILSFSRIRWLLAH